MDREPTLEELMAELDAAANGETATSDTDLDFSLDDKKESEPNLAELTPSSNPKPTANEEISTVTNVTTEVKSISISTENVTSAAEVVKSVASPAVAAVEDQRGIPQASRSGDVDNNDPINAPKSRDIADEVVLKPQAAEKKKEPSSSFTSQLESFWKSAKASAEEMLPMKDEISSKVGNILATAGDSISAAASNVGTAARTRNAKILMKPYASFGVPLELIMKRECGDETAEQVPAVIEKLLSFLDKNRGVDGDIPLEFFTKPRAAADRDRLLDLRDEIDLVGIRPACTRCPASPRSALATQSIAVE